MRFRLCGILGIILLLIVGCSDDDMGGGQPAESALPAAAADLLVLTEGQLPIDGEDVESGSDFELTIPSGTLRLTYTGGLDSVPAEVANANDSPSPQTEASPDSPSDSGNLRAADGHSFLAAEIVFETSQELGNSASLPSLSVAADRSTIGEVSNLDLTGRYEGALVISVPTSAEDIELAVDFAGLTQTLDLRTGERTSDAAEAYYDGGATRIDPSVGNRLDSTVTVPFPEVDFVDAGECVITATGSASTATRTPWLTDNGWAPEGSSWVTVELSGYSAEGECSTFLYSFRPADLVDSATLVAANGDVIQPTSGSEELMVFNSPASELSLTLHVAVVGEIRTGGSSIPVALPPVDVVLDFN